MASSILPLLVLVGCGSAGTRPVTLPTSRPTTASSEIGLPTGVAACLRGVPRIRRPAAFPVSFPLPKGIYLTTASAMKPGINLIGYVPSSSFTSTYTRFTQSLARNGWTQGLHENQAPRDAESLFTGHGYTGQWALQRVARCRSVLSLAVLTVPAG